MSAHTDNPYRKPIPGIQLLHCIKNESIGGSTLTDGFAVAEYLRKKYPKIFRILSNVKIRFAYMDKNNCLENWGKTIELDENNKIKRVRLSPRLDYVPMLSKPNLNNFYKARSFFIKLSNSKKFMIEFKLKPGDILVMDNYRTLHGRTSFNLLVGQRHLKDVILIMTHQKVKLNILKG